MTARSIPSTAHVLGRASGGLAAALIALAALPSGAMAAAPAVPTPSVPTVTTVELTSTSVNVGDTITINATVEATMPPTGPSAAGLSAIPGDPSGTVAFAYCLNRSLPEFTCTDGDWTSIGTPATVGTDTPGNGVVTASIDWVPEPGYGWYLVQAQYGGDDWFMPSSNATAYFHVGDPTLSTAVLDTPHDYEAGGDVTVCVHHVLAGSEVGFQVRDWDLMELVTADEAGDACLTFRIPESAYPGVYLLGAVVTSETWQVLFLTTNLGFPPSTCCGLPDSASTDAAVVAVQDDSRSPWIPIIVLAAAAGAVAWTRRAARARG